jgi:thioredoxin reductase (NADPH)
MTELDKDEQFYRDTETIAFPKLDDRELAMLEPLGARRIIRRGELVFEAGQRNLGLTAVLRGELEVFDSRDGQEQILATSGPHGFIGNVAMLMGTASLTNARGKADESEILEVPADRLRQALAELPGVSETIVRAFIMRQQRLKRDREFAGLRILAQNDSQDGHRLDDFLDKNHDRLRGRRGLDRGANGYAGKPAILEAPRRGSCPPNNCGRTRSTLFERAACVRTIGLTN